jgi:hypothetical protein
VQQGSGAVRDIELTLGATRKSTDVTAAPIVRLPAGLPTSILETFPDSVAFRVQSALNPLPTDVPRHERLAIDRLTTTGTGAPLNLHRRRRQINLARIKSRERFLTKAATDLDSAGGANSAEVDRIVLIGRTSVVLAHSVLQQRRDRHAQGLGEAFQSLDGGVLPNAHFQLSHVALANASLPGEIPLSATLLLAHMLKHVAEPLGCQ